MSEHLRTDPNIECIERFVRPFVAEEHSFDSKIWKSYEFDDNFKRFLPYVGNGKFAIAVYNSDNTFNILSKRALDLEIPFHPIVEVDYFGAQAKRNGK